MSCKRNSIEHYQSSIDSMLQPANKTAKEQNVFDVGDMRGCGMEIEKGEWYRNKNLFRAGVEIWSRHVSSNEKGIIASGNEYVDANPENFSHLIAKNPKAHIVYIGPWQFQKNIGKEIRFVAYTGSGGGHISYHFESKTPENTAIKEKPFSLPIKLSYPPKEQLCMVKWIANFGYDAISTVKSQNPFSRNFLVPTGRIIDAYTGELIKDLSSPEGKNK